MAERKDPEKLNRKVNGESEAEPSPASAPDSPEESPQVSADAPPAEQITKLQAEKTELWQTLVRRQADFENYRRRIERERHEEGQRATARLIEALLPVLDAFERALATHDDPAYEDYRKGFAMIERHLREALARHGLERIDAAGKLFDPHVHLAIERVESEEHADGTVLEVLQLGYTLRGKLLRPASVRVAVRPGATTSKRQELAN